MPYAPINILLNEPLHAGQPLSVPYPEGRNEGTFFSGVNHTMTMNGFFYRCPRDFIVTTQPDRIVFTWNGEFPLPARALLNLQLESPGDGFYTDAKNNITVRNMVHSPMFMVNLSAPHAAVEDHYAQRQVIGSPQPLKIRNERADCARNVIVGGTEENRHCTFLIDGTDIYGRTVRESITGTTAGRKAFERVSRITPSHPCNGEIWVGTGNTLGLPVFLPTPGYLMREIINGKTATGGAVVSGDAGMPGSISGDARGTYTPPSAALPDGRNIIHLLLSLPNPGNIGLAE